MNRILFSFCVLAVFLIAVTSCPKQETKNPTFKSPGKAKTLLICDLANETGDATWDDVSIGIADAVSTKLTHISSLKLTDTIKRKRTMAKQRFGESESVSEQTAAETGKLVKATTVFYGSYTIDGDQLKVTAHILNCDTAQPQGSFESVSSKDHTSVVVNDLCLKILSTLEIKASEEEMQIIGKDDIGRTLDTLVLWGNIDRILCDKSGLSRDFTPEKELNKAKDLCERILSVEPDNPMVLNCFGNIWQGYYGLGDDNKALDYYRQALEKDPQFVSAHLNISSILGEQGDLEGAMKECEQVKRIDPDNTGVHIQLSYILHKKKDIDGAIKESRTALKLDPESYDSHYGLGERLLENNDFEGAMKEFDEAVRLNPEAASGYYGIGCVYYMKTEFDKALVEYDKVVRINPKSADTWCLIGICCAEVGRSEDAKDAFIQAMKYSKSGEWAYDNAKYYISLL